MWGGFTFSTSDFETRPSLATSRLMASRLRTAFMRVMLCAWVKPPFSRSLTSVKVSKWWIYGGACRCGGLCSSSSAGAPIWRTWASGLETVSGGASANSLGCDSAASALTEFSARCSLETGALSGDGGFSFGVDLLESAFFSSGGDAGDCTSFSIAVARDFGSSDGPSVREAGGTGNGGGRLGSLADP